MIFLKQKKEKGCEFRIPDSTVPQTLQKHGGQPYI